MDVQSRLEALLAERLVITDGAMGTMIQRQELVERDYRGDMFAHHTKKLRGCCDVLCLTKPEVILGIHRAYLSAGADIIETNTFNAQSVSLADYGLEPQVIEINRAAARLARQAADEAMQRDPSQLRFVAGSVGPTNRAASQSPHVSQPSLRAISFDELARAYGEQVRALLDGGVDILLPETVFDTLNLKAALFAIESVFEERGTRVPVMVSLTITNQSSRTPSTQTIEDFWASVQHAKPFAVGLNCSFGPEAMRPYIEKLSQLATTYTCCFPNAGLPNALGGYDETPEQMAVTLGDFARRGWLNLVGGCCGTTPEHIAAIAAGVREATPRTPSRGRSLGQ